MVQIELGMNFNRIESGIQNRKKKKGNKRKRKRKRKRKKGSRVEKGRGNTTLGQEGIFILVPVV